ncbi:MAG: hypothetical protein JWR35_1277 [Marmoricola sp.]|nr:hypothetical protein [Marmoricola sp.]
MADFSYADVGATRDGVLPPDAYPVHEERQIGQGHPDFDRAAAAVLRFDLQRAAGLRIVSAPAKAVESATLEMVQRVGPLKLRVPCRVVYVIAEPRRRGFAYGTLPGHPESGEECFVVELREDDSVWIVITAFSRPGRWFTRLGGPLARAFQRRATEKYLSALG